jgi:4-amino-4-deoxy-L-arabinose transferase-like glycosyltransferase
LVILGVTAALVLLPGLGNHDLWAPDEPHYGQVSREMMTSGDWLLPHVNGRIYTDKPPGWFWCAALLSLPGGDVTPLTARLPSALAALALLLLVAAWGERRLGAGSGTRAAVVLASTFLFFDLGRSAHLDMLLALLVTLSLLAGREVIAEGGGRGGRLLFWLAAGLGVLVKGPLALLLPLLVVTVDRLLVARRPRDLLRLQPWWGLPLALALPLGWLLAVSATRPGYDPLTVINRHVLSRFGSGLHHAQPFWYFGVQFFLELMPWGFLMPVAALAAWHFGATSRTAEREDEAGVPVPGRDRRRFLVIWVVVILLFFSVSKEKRGLYIMPLVPAAALLVADFWHRLRTGDQRSGWMVRGGLGVIAALFMALGVLPLALARRPVAGAPGLETLSLVLAVLGVGGGCAVLVSLLRRRLPAALRLTAATFLALLLVYAHGLQPTLDTVRSARGLAQELGRQLQPGDPVAMLEWRAAYLYYSGVRMEELGNDEAAVAWMAAPGGRRLLLLRGEAWERLRPRMGTVQELGSHGTGPRRVLLLERPAGPPPA